MRKNPKQSDDANRKFGTPEMRKRLKKFYADFADWQARSELFEQETGRFWTEFPEPSPTYPKDLSGMLCGAKNRKGLPCKISDIFSNGRCKFHGGASTGPKTKRGKRKSAKNGFGKPRGIDLAK